MNKRILLYSLTLVLAVALIFGLLGTINAKQDETAAKFATMARFATFVSNQYEAGQVDQLERRGRTRRDVFPLADGRWRPGRNSRPVRASR